MPDDAPPAAPMSADDYVPPPIVNQPPPATQEMDSQINLPPSEALQTVSDRESYLRSVAKTLGIVITLEGSVVSASRPPPSTETSHKSRKRSRSEGPRRARREAPAAAPGAPPLSTTPVTHNAARTDRTHVASLQPTPSSAPCSAQPAAARQSQLSKPAPVLHSTVPTTAHAVPPPAAASTPVLPDFRAYVNPSLNLSARGGLVSSVDDIDDNDAFSSVDGDDDSSSGMSSVSDSIVPLDSVSNVQQPEPMAPTPADPPSPNPLAAYRGMENSLHTGFAQALPKHSKGIKPSDGAELAWYHMRGFSTATDSDSKLPKADKINKNYTSKQALAFRPPTLPTQLPFSNSFRESDNRLRSTMSSYSAPAHTISQLFTETETKVTTPLSGALTTPLAIRGDEIRRQLQSALEFMQGTGSLLMGYALRSLGSSYNDIANRRRSSVLSVQSPEVRQALSDVRIGFSSFFHDDIDPLVARAQQTQQLRLTQAALSAHAPRPYQPSFGHHGYHFNSFTNRFHPRDERRHDNHNRQRSARDKNQNKNRKFDSTPTKKRDDKPNHPPLVATAVVGVTPVEVSVALEGVGSRMLPPDTSRVHITTLLH